MVVGGVAGLLTRVREEAAPFYGLAATLGIGLPLRLLVDDVNELISACPPTVNPVR